jgi:hypothetical protein
MDFSKIFGFLTELLPAAQVEAKDSRPQPSNSLPLIRQAWVTTSVIGRLIFLAGTYTAEAPVSDEPNCRPASCVP